MLPKESLQALKDGNNRFVQKKPLHPHQNDQRLREVLPEQHPFAVILTCSDSRVPPEILFDQGIGDLYVIRTAGNVIDDVVIGSIEYAVTYLRVPLVVVMGHQNCGAVTAAALGGISAGHISSLIQKLRPAVEIARGVSGDLVANAVDANTLLVAAELKNCRPELIEFYASGSIDILAARYNLDSGKVTFF